MLRQAIEQTLKFLESMPKTTRKKKGQFFTSSDTARFMAKMFDFKSCKNHISVLDPGAGTGILSVAFIERALSIHQDIQILLTCYEIDTDVLPILKNNLEYVKSLHSTQIDYQIISEDYILSQSNDFNENLLASDHPKKYDFIISNPPYLRITKDNPVAKAMMKVVCGAPNLYFLFVAMSLFNLKQEAEMVYIIPRSWTSGAYFKTFRKYLFTNGIIEQIHLFVSRDKVFSIEEILQETMIVKIKKTATKPDSICITSSDSNSDFDNITEFNVLYETVASGKNMYVYLPVNEEELDVIKKVNKYHSTLPDEGLIMKTGMIIDFRHYDELREEPGDHIIPLFYSQHIRDGRVYHQPSGKGHDWIIDKKITLIQENKNYIFIKRFTAKEEKRRLQCGIYSPADFKEYEYIGTQNKINFIDSIDGSEMDILTTYGVFALLNSTLFDMYYRILNGSTQVNSTEMNTIPIPPIYIIKKIGEQLLVSGDLSTNSCDKIILEAAYV